MADYDPITITHGTNELVSLGNIGERIEQILSGDWKQKKKIELWDGKSAKRIVTILDKWTSEEAVQAEKTMMSGKPVSKVFSQIVEAEHRKTNQS